MFLYAEPILKACPNMPIRILHIVTNVAHYDDATHPTGLWLSELTHAWHEFGAAGYEQIIASPLGGLSPLEPRALKWPNIDRTAKNWLADQASMDLLARTHRPNDLDARDFDAIYFTGGHGVMYDFPDAAGVQTLTQQIYEKCGVVSAVCHGYCGLLETRLSNGELLVKGRKLTGYSWREEIWAGVAKRVPYDVEQRMKDNGALYEKALIPFVPNVVVDGRLITGQNPASANATAKAVIEVLGKSK